MTDVINQFSGDNHFLSNFYHSPIVVQGITYPTVEHAYQAAKATERSQKAEIATARTPGIAKKLGRECTIRPNWEDVKEVTMGQLIMLKFQSHDDLRAKLLSTGDTRLVEGNYWGDREWGVFKGRGQNKLGRILMRVREELRNE